MTFDPGEGTSAHARARTESISSDEEDNYLQRLRRLRNWGPSSDEDESDNDPPPSPPPVAIPAPPAGPDVEVPDPFDGHVPANENLTPCPCEPPSGPCDVPVPETTQRRFTTQRQRHFSNRGGPVPPFPTQTRSPNVEQRPRPPHYFSNPKPNNFSFRRRRPDVNAFFNLITDHLNS